LFINLNPTDYTATHTILCRSGWKRARKEEQKEPNEDFIDERPVLATFEEAVQLGWESKHNSTDCEQKYSICPLSTDDVFAHFDTIKLIQVV